MSYRNKTYVAFDGDNDIRYYHLMQAWKQNEHIDFNFYDAHELRQAWDSSKEETIKRSLRYRMNESKIFVLLVGEHTRNLYKFVRWEIEVALSLGLPIIVVNLNGKKQIDNILCPPILKDKLAIHIPFGAKIMRHALDHWVENHREYTSNNKIMPYHYIESVYVQLGI